MAQHTATTAQETRHTRSQAVANRPLAEAPATKPQGSNRKAHFNYRNIRLDGCEGTCSSFSQWQVEALYRGAKRANKREVNALVKRDLPDLYEALALNYNNPYNYYRTERHIILVHSQIDHFIAYD